MHRRLFLVFAMWLASLQLCDPAWSQAYPQRPVRIVVGFSAGGPDITARIVAHQLALQTGQSFIVDNRPGASGTLGSDIVAKAAPDGYTLLVSSASLAISANLYKKLPFNPATDLLPISHLVSAEGHVLSVTPSLPVQNVKELIALGRKPDSKLGYGSPGVGAAVHLKAALFNSKMGMHMVHVPYKGGGPMLNALMAGEVQVMFINPSSGLALIKSGKIRALAYDSDTRAPFLPDVPSMVEAGVSPTQLDASWHGLFAPARVPASVVARLESEIRKAYALPEVREQFVKLGLIPIGDSSSEFKPFVANAFKQFREATQAAGIEPE